MKVESIIKRNPPTSIMLGDTAYQFEPDSEGRHVCEVSDQQHLAKLLSIPEGYRLVLDGSQEQAPKQPQQPTIAPIQPTIQPVSDDGEDNGVLLGSDVHPAVIDLGDGRTVQLGEVVQKAFADSGMTTKEWNEQDEDDRYAKIDAVLDSMIAPPMDSTLAGVQNQDGTVTPLEEMPKDGLLKIAADMDIEGAEGMSAEQLVAAIKAAQTTPALEGDLNGDGTLDREELAKLFKAKFGKRPNGSLSAEKIKAELEKAE